MLNADLYKWIHSQREVNSCRFRSTLGFTVARNAVAYRQCLCGFLKRLPVMAGEHDEELVAHMLRVWSLAVISLKFYSRIKQRSNEEHEREISRSCSLARLKSPQDRCHETPTGPRAIFVCDRPKSKQSV